MAYGKYERGYQYLVVVESPNKIGKINKILGSRYKILATKGHIEDLERNSTSVDETTLEPILQVIPGKEYIIKQILDFACSSQCKVVYLASDPDREGEAISWSVWRRIPKELQYKCKRATFHAITEKDVKESIARANDSKGDCINLNMVKAQQARRVIDRLVGYGVGSAIRRFFGSDISVGRVQTPVLRYVVDRDEDRRLFIPKPFYDVIVTYDILGSLGAASSAYAQTKLTFSTREKATGHKDSIQFPHRVKNVTSKSRKVAAGHPHNTSSMQSAGFRSHGMSAGTSMKAAQRMFETGKANYPRTDSYALSDEFVMEIAKPYIIQTFGEEYFDPKEFMPVNEFVQGAHEALRPMRLNVKKSEFSDVDEQRLFGEISRRAIASQMPPAVIDDITIEVEDNRGRVSTIMAQELRFPGHFKVSGIPELTAPPIGLKKGMILHRGAVAISPGETKPLPRINEATLIENMEEKRIGRPATTAPTIEGLRKKGYFEEVKDKQDSGIDPSDKGKRLIALLKEKYPSIVDDSFTARMEYGLDAVEQGNMDPKDAVIQTIQEFGLNGIDISPSGISSMGR